MESCAFTGHRPNKFRFGYDETSDECRLLKRRMLGVLSGLYKKGVRRYYVGGALGADMWAGELIAWLKERPDYPGIELILAAPFPQYERKWSEEEKQRLHRLMERCSETLYIGFADLSSTYLERDRYMVDHADCLFAVYDGIGSPHSGTKYTVEYAAGKDIPIWLLDPDTLELKKI